MKCKSILSRVPLVSLVLAAAIMWTTRLPAADEAAQILEHSGIQGGLVVHLGCSDGRLTAALRASQSYLVHGLDRDPVRVDEARRWLLAKGLYGPVSVDVWEGTRLPYADNLVNLLVISDAKGNIADEEIRRVLAPRGTALWLNPESKIRNQKFIKPWPKEIDEWTHHLHDSGGNAVAHDKLVGPPRHLQWTAGPLWSRSHGWTPSVSAMVSAGGRVFYLCDETLTCVDGTVSDQWFLTARDAFSGVRLWKRPVPHWGSAELSGTPGTGAGSTTGRFTMPPNLGKRLVAVGDTVYVTLGAAAPVTALDAATGQPRRTYAETARTDEILSTGDRLIVTLNPPEKPEAATPDKANPPAPTPGKRVCAVDTATGKVLWNKGPFTAIRATKTQDPFGRLELAAGDGRVIILTHEAIEALSLETGETAWRIPRPALPEAADRRIGFAGIYEFLLTTMVYHDGVVLLAQPEPNSPHTYHTMPGTLWAFDAKDGRLMWKHAYGAWGHCTQPDVFVVGGLVWTHENVKAQFNIDARGWIKVPNTAEVDYRIQGLDLRTGEVQKELSTKDLFNVGHHHRCYRNKITDQFLTASRRGVEFVDLASGENYQNHWVRSGCLLGNLPCNGLLYVAPHACGCYIEAKLTGFNALAASRDAGQGATDESVQLPRLQRGPAYEEAQRHIGTKAQRSDDWPTYRHDPQRSGATESAIGSKVVPMWKSALGVRPSGLVVAGGRVLVAGVDAHTVYALSADDGKRIWSYTAGARVDSPPTIHNGLAIFGSADGRVYALRASDGVLAWRFDAAPQQSRVAVADQLESPWPVPGSVLVHDGKCWFAAGRSSYLDDGILLYALEPASGKILHRETIYSPDPKTGKIAPETGAQFIPGLLNDIPATDGASVFVRQMSFAPSGGSGGRHLFSTGGYLDPTWFNRTFWKIGQVQTSGLMVLGKDVAYGMELYGSRSRETVFRPGANQYRLLCLPLTGTAGRSAARQAKAKLKEGGLDPVWQQRLAIRVTAMVRAGEMVLVAGSPDVVDPTDPHGAWEGRKGGVLAAFSADDGKQLAELKLPSPPVWDGMAVAGGALYLATMDGNVLCYR